MEIYLNHNKLQTELSKIKGVNAFPEICEQFHEILSDLKHENYKLSVLSSWKNNVFCSLSTEPRKYMGFLIDLQKTGNIEEIAVTEILKSVDFIPSILERDVRTVLSCCVRDEKDLFVSLQDDVDATEEFYEVRSLDRKLYSIKTRKDLERYIKYHPMPNNMQELFKKVQSKCPDIIFTKEAYATVTKRENAYKKYGYDKMLKIFYGVEETLLKFYALGRSGKSEKDVFEDFRKEYGVEISPDTDQTLKMYGRERQVKIGEQIYTMSNHIKIPIQQARIYFKYINGKIYIGHSGEHLRTAKNR